MKNFLIFVFSILCIFVNPAIAGSFQNQNKASIFGKVTSSIDMKPLANVNIFIANTMLGAATNDSGYFAIRNVPLGTHELVVTNIGFEPRKLTIRLAREKDKEINLKLIPKAVQAPEIQITARREPDWKKHLKKFQKFFLGTSRNASKCKITNPEVLEFREDKTANLFMASAGDIIHIENRALGYRLSYLLDSFNLSDEMVGYNGKTKFQELLPANRKEQEKWRKNRLKTYNGSLRHFFQALISNQIKKAGFMVSRLPELTDQVFYAELQEVNLSSLFSDGDLSFEKKLHFFDYLQIIYSKEIEDREYVYWRLNQDKSAIGMTTQKLRESRLPRAQTSWIVLNKTPVTIDTTGYLYDPLALTVYGYWAWESVADILPFEYSPQ